MSRQHAILQAEAKDSHFALLSQEWTVDSYAKIESGRLNYLRKEQTKLRADKYKHVQAAVEAVLQGQDIGKPFVLPSSFVGGECHMRQLYQVSLHAAIIAQVCAFKQLSFVLSEWFLSLGCEKLAFTWCLSCRLYLPSVSILLAVTCCNTQRFKQLFCCSYTVWNCRMPWPGLPTLASQICSSPSPAMPIGLRS